MGIIAICDDVAIDRKRIADISMKYLISTGNEGKWIIHLYSSEKELLTEIEKTAADIFLLDIKLVEIDGIDIAKRIHAIQPAAIIIYVSGYLDYSLKGYEDGFRFVDKKAMESELPRALSTALKQFEKGEQRYVVLTLNEQGKNSGYVRINISEIVYTRREGYITEIYTVRHGIIKESFFSVRDFYTQLNSKRFVFIDKGTFINVNYFEKIEKNIHKKNYYSVKLKMPDGESVYFGVSRRGRKMLLDEITKRWDSNSLD